MMVVLSASFCVLQRVHAAVYAAHSARFVLLRLPNLSAPRRLSAGRVSVRATHEPSRTLFSWSWESAITFILRGAPFDGRILVPPPPMEGDLKTLPVLPLAASGCTI